MILDVNALGKDAGLIGIDSQALRLEIISCTLTQMVSACSDRVQVKVR